MIDAAKGFYASSAGYQTVFETVTAQLLSLPTQVSAEQFIVDAIEQSRDALLDSLDTNGDGMISLQEATNTALASIFHELDLNGDGQLSKLELIRGTTRATADSTEYQNAILAQTNGLVGASNSLLSSANAIAAAQEALLSQIRSLNSTQYLTLEALRGQFGLNNVVGINGITLSNNMVEALNKIVFNTASTVIGQKAGAPYTYASGGYVSGPGSGTSDSINARLSNGEFVMRAAAVDRFGVGTLNRMNDNFSMPAVPVPVGVGESNAALIAEIKALRTEVAALRSDTRAGATMVAGETRSVVEGVAIVAAETRGARTDARQAANRPEIRRAKSA